MGEKTAVAIVARDCNSDEPGAANDVLIKQSYLLKMDLRLIPILGCTYTILFLDRTNSRPSVSTIVFMLIYDSRKRPHRRVGERPQYARKWVQHSIVDLLHTIHPDRGAKQPDHGTTPCEAKRFFGREHVPPRCGGDVSRSDPIIWGTACVTIPDGYLRGHLTGWSVISRTSLFGL